jgi:protein phosphatase
MSEQPAAETSAVTPERLVVQAVLRTDVGLVRSENQDFGTYTTPSEEREAHPGGRLLVVADGMGGHRGGATASRIAGETVKAQYLGAESDEVLAALRDSLLRANSRIFHEAQANPDLRGMGTTTSALVVRDGNAWFGHVGDSRIYMLRDDELTQLTEDHSLVATMVREGLLTKSEAENHPRRNVLQRSMGVQEDVEIDVKGPFSVREGDTFILCSDGLHGVVKEDEIRAIARQPIREAADEYIKKAIERGAPDNVTVIVARVTKASEVGEDTLPDREERQRDTERLPAYVDTPVGAQAPDGDRTGEAPVPPQEPSPLPGGGQAPRLSASASDHSALRWALFAVLAAAAASAWLFWTR